MSGSSGSNSQKPLRELAWAIAMSEGQFSLILAHCNYLSLRSRSVQQLHEICAVPIRELVLHPSNQLLYSTIQQEVATQIPSALMVLGLESVNNLDYLLTSMNQVREEFRKNCPFPLVIWVNDEIVRKLIRLVPDIESWAKRTVLTYPPETLIHELHQNTNTLFTKVFDLGISPFLANDAILGRNVSGEIQAALQELKNQGRDIPETLQASLDFVWGREAYDQDKIDLALANYQHSLAFWQQVKHFLLRCSLVATKKLFWTLLLVYYIKSETSVAGESPSPEPTLREKEGSLLFHIGLCYCRKAELDKAQSCHHWYKALLYFQQCIDGFEQVGRLDLVAKFIGQLGEVWRRLENWDELHKLAQKAQPLHKKHGNPASLAQNYGFFAEVALYQHQGNKAKAFVKKALQLSDATTEEQHQSWYLLLLARSQQQLGQVQEAIKTLETAKKAEPENNPLLYIQILNELRDLYYQQHRYLEAFDVKQCRRSIEQQFNFRAFIGAGRLQSRRQATFSLTQSEHRETVAREILASGRENDIKGLIARIGSTQHKLTVIYGQSGVGKSSLVNAGLLPTLRYQNIGTDTRDILAVPLRVYTDWVKDLGKSLFKALEKRGITLSAIPDSAATLIEQLTQNEHHNLLTVLIFDQFEEFFFICSESEQKEQIFEFLGKCLNIPGVKVVLSMRKDYLHDLLIGNHLPHLDAIQNDILSKNILYPLGNFSRKDAKNLIRHLTDGSQFPLEPALIHEVVKDLASRSKEVRPIELQVVCAQLQTEEITTLVEYQERGPKDKLVQRYLGEVIKDCGTENQRTAELVLYLLTHGKKPRPLKSHADLEAQLKALAADLAIKPDKLKAGTSQQLSLVLDILVKSGLVFKITDSYGIRYQIVHDYLTYFIRNPRERNLLDEIKSQFSQKQLIYVQKQKNFAAVAVGFILVISTVLSQHQRQEAESQRQKAEFQRQEAEFQREEAEKNQILARIKTSEALSASGQRFESLIEAINAGSQFKQKSTLLSNKKILEQVVAALKQSIYWIKESNRLERHKSIVWDVSVLKNEDGKPTTIASASYDGTVILWKPDGELIQEFKAHEDRLLSVNFSPNGQIMATASFDKKVKLWKSNGQGSFKDFPYKTIQGHNKGVYDVSFSPDGKIIATASRDKTVKLWDLDGSFIQTLEGHDKGVNSVVFSPDSKIIATASRDNTVKLWQRTDEDKFESIRDKTLQGHSDIVWAVKFSPDGKMIATASRDNTVKLWSLDGRFARTIKGHKDSVLSMSFSPNGRSIATASQDNTVKVWNVGNGQLKTTLTGHSNGVYDVSFLSENRLVSASADHSLKLWQLGNKIFKKTLNGHTGKVWDVSFSPEGERIASASADGTVKLWQRDASTDGNHTLDYKLLKILTGHKKEVLDVSFSQDGQTIATASDDTTVQVWTGDGIRQWILYHDDQVFGVSVSPDGKTIATASRDNTVRLWTFDGIWRNTLTMEHSDWVRDVTFSPDGQIIASASDDTIVKLWKPDGNLITTLKGNNGHKSWVRSVAFSPDSKIIATASEDNTAKLWTIAGEYITTLEGHRDQVRSVAFSPKDKIIATASDDKTVKLWNWDGSLRRTLPRHRDGIRGVSFSPDGQTLALASANNTVILWDFKEIKKLDELDELLRYGCDWLEDYIKTNPKMKPSDADGATNPELPQCEGIGTQ
ncbi:MAG: AAA family ATPase [Coleofasciculus chthonoplastes F3-SA18-01]|uniref:WD40 domain-containing protein n=1 Tax=Coleofasciculus chthonoplastes TaxID=64178 RepID=UPI0032FC0E69